MDESGTAHDLLLDRNQKFLIGSRYRIYLQNSSGTALLDTRVPNSALLGLEDLGEYRAESVSSNRQTVMPESSNITKTEEFNE